MKKKRGSKRKQPLLSSSSARRPKIKIIDNPYPGHLQPDPDECGAIRDILLAHHGFPKQFIQQRLRRFPQDKSFTSSDGDGDGDGDGDDEIHSNSNSNSHSHSHSDSDSNSESVLDGLVSIILSQNTNEANSQRAFSSLKSAFPTWEHVLVAESKHVEDAIRCGGLAPSKTACLKNLLDTLFKNQGKLCLEYLHDLSVDQIKAELSLFKGIGPKTVACVLMFHLQRDDFPVDTHVLEISKRIGWLPKTADVKKAYLHLNSRIPDNLKFDLNCLLYTHGKACQQCSKRGDNHQILKKENPCPLLMYCKNSISIDDANANEKNTCCT